MRERFVVRTWLAGCADMGSLSVSCSLLRRNRISIHEAGMKSSELFYCMVIRTILSRNCTSEQASGAGKWERSNQKKMERNGNPRTQVQKPNLGHPHPAEGQNREPTLARSARMGHPAAPGTQLHATRADTIGTGIHA
jgi:hypothetical protein